MPFNDVDALDAAFAANGDELAAALVEPVRRQHGPRPARRSASSSTWRSRCTEHGALLVCDEVITGFRLGPAGAQGRFDLTPDLSIFGKVIGGGLPLAAVGGRADVMDHLAPVGDVYQAGTLSGNPLATAAGLAALGRARSRSATPTLEAACRAASPTACATAVQRRRARRVQVPRVGTLSGLFFGAAPVRELRGRAGRCDHETYARVLPRACSTAGVFLAPSGYEVMFVSLAHTDADLDRTVELAAEAAHEIA